MRARSPITTPTTGSSRRTAELPTTSQPSIGDFLAVYEPLLAAGNEIVSIHLSGGLSGTVRSAEQAREQLGEAAKRSARWSTPRPPAAAEGLMLLAAAAAARTGGGRRHGRGAGTAGPRRAAVPVCARHARIPAPGGRIGGAQAWLGTALKIKPILSLESEIGAVERVRTSRRAFERLVITDRGAEGQTAPTAGSFSTPRCPSRQRLWRARAARSSAPTRCSSPKSGR